MKFSSNWPKKSFENVDLGQDNGDYHPIKICSDAQEG